MNTAPSLFESQPIRLLASCAGILDPQSSRPAPTAAVGPHYAQVIKSALNLKARSISFWKVPWEEQLAQVRSATPNPANGYGSVNQRHQPLRELTAHTNAAELCEKSKATPAQDGVDLGTFGVEFAR